jgi:hypothetical protein
MLLKKEHTKAFVMAARDELVLCLFGSRLLSSLSQALLWDSCYIGSAQQASFAPAFSEVPQ